MKSTHTTTRPTWSGERILPTGALLSGGYARTGQSSSRSVCINRITARTCMDARLYSSAYCVTRLGRLADEFGPTVGPPMRLLSLDTAHAVLISSR